MAEVGEPRGGINGLFKYGIIALLSGALGVGSGAGGLKAYEASGWRAMEDRHHELELRLQKIEGTTFTSEHGLDLWQAINDLRMQILTAEPPKWFVKRVDGLEATQKEILTEIKEIRRSVNP